MTKNKSEKEINLTISKRYAKTIEKRKSQKIFRGLESWIVGSISEQLRPEKLSKENAETHNFHPTNQDAISGNELKCDKCGLIGEVKKNGMYAREDLSCNEYLMKQVVE